MPARLVSPDGTHLRVVAGNYRALIAVFTAVLTVSGLACLGAAISSQQHPPQPPLTIVNPSSPATREPTRTPRSPHPPTTTPVVGLVLPASPPVGLSIPVIGVHSVLLSLGQAADGSLEVPAPGSHYDQAGWYRYSPTPGSLGPAVIVGHVDSIAHGPSVFFRLGALHPGDTVLVAREDGSVAVFAVDDVRRYHKSDFPTQLVYGDTNHAALHLITCGGPFDRHTGHYLDNIIVRASLVRFVAGPQATVANGDKATPSPPQTQT
jgi:sortase (surface protein transpeptidase)